MEVHMSILRKKQFSFTAISAFVLITLLSLLSCSSGGGGSAAPANVSYTVGGTVTGLAGSGLVLQNNVGDDLAVSTNGTFTFATAVANGAAYAVTVKTQPSGPSQTCTASNNTGAIADANITGVSIVCSVNAYTVSGTVSGLAGSGLVLRNNGIDDLTVSANGMFTFAAAVADGAGYAVTVKTQPEAPPQTCVVGNGSGTVSGANVTSVTISCSSYVPRFAYSANSWDNTISLYTVNAATGQMRHNGFISAGTMPYSVAVDPKGRFAYAANSGDGTVSV